MRIKEEKIKQVEPYTPAWERKANKVAREYADIIACRTCGNPRIAFCMCTYCNKE